MKILDLKLEAKAGETKTKREAIEEEEEEEEEGAEDETEEKCRVDMWRCLSKVRAVDWVDYYYVFFFSSCYLFNIPVLSLSILVVFPLQVIEGGLHYMDKPEGLMG